MTEMEWLECPDPIPMLWFLQGKVSDRKLRLFACACCRRICLRRQETEPTYSLHPAVITSEDFADGLVSREKLRFARSQIGGMGSYSAKSSAYSAINVVVHDNSARAAVGAAGVTADFFSLSAYEAVGYDKPGCQEAANSARENECKNLAAIMHDIFGNPFHPVVIDPRWQTSTVVDLATVIYDERAIDRMPILADALMDAGCDNDEIIAHCRGPAPHVRGCWVVDSLLRKE